MKIIRSLLRRDGTCFAAVAIGEAVHLVNASASNTDVLSKFVLSMPDHEPWSLAAELELMHPNRSASDRLSDHISRAQSAHDAAVERARIAVTGTPGQQADRDQKAALALNATNANPAMSDIRDQALNLLDLSASAIGIKPEGLADAIKIRRDRQAAILAALDQIRITFNNSLPRCLSHDDIDGVLSVSLTDIQSAVSS